MISQYTSRGLIVTDIKADNEFSFIDGQFKNINVSIVAADAHVPEIEREIRTIKESIRCIVHGLPFSRLPKILLTHIVRLAVRMLNHFVSKGSTGITPHLIISGKSPLDYNSLRLEIGSYCMVSDSTSNDMGGRTLPALALLPTDSGSHMFLNLITAKRIHRHQWTVLPITEAVIRRTHDLAEAEAQPVLRNKMPLFEWSPNVVIEDCEDAFDDITSIVDDGMIVSDEHHVIEGADARTTFENNNNLDDSRDSVVSVVCLKERMTAMSLFLIVVVSMIRLKERKTIMHLFLDSSLTIPTRMTTMRRLRMKIVWNRLLLPLM